MIMMTVTEMKTNNSMITKLFLDQMIFGLTVVILMFGILVINIRCFQRQIVLISFFFY